MPHLKFTRDKKGYEHTSLVRPPRKGGRGEGRILYWFRTPPHVKVGRSALDEEAIRLLEEQHPDITFDWPRILKAQPVIVEEPRAHKLEQREARRRKGQPKRDAETHRPPASVAAEVRGGKPAEPGREARHPVERFQPSERKEPVEPLEPLEPIEPSTLQLQDLKEPTMIEAAVQEDGVSEWEAPVEAEPLERASEAGGAFLSPRPVEALVGTEGLERLRARHAALLAAISEGIPDPAKREFLRAEAERLDPDGWVTIDAARAALETYESDYETLRRQLPARRRRRRRGRRGAKTGTRPTTAEQGQYAEPRNSAAGADSAEPHGEPDEPDDSDSEEPER